MINRRSFIRQMGSLVALSALPGSHSFAFRPTNLSTEQQPKQILVVVFLRGGCDALQWVAPVNDPAYIQARPSNLRVPNKGSLLLKNGLAGLDFAMHPKAAALRELYDQGHLAIVHATGLANGTRSHFEASAIIEQGFGRTTGGSTGWLSRYLQQNDWNHPTHALAMGKQIPTSLMGYSKALAVDALDEFKVHGSDAMPKLLESFYSGTSPLDQTGQQTLQALRYLGQEQFQEHHHHHNKYPDEWYLKDFSKSLKNLAHLIKSNAGVHVATVEYDNWDHHQHQADRFPTQLEGLSKSLAAFYNDLHAQQQQLTIVVMSEFGRRLKSNRSGGTDHGYGGLSLVLGGGIKGGRMYGSWPGLHNQALDQGMDLDITTDYRTVLSEVLSQRLAAKDLEQVFPGFQAGQLGLFT